jgi:hypothetical protein
MNAAALADVQPGLALAGRGAGARLGDWRLRVVESADIVGGRVVLDGLREIEVERNVRTERHLLRPYDVLVTGRSQAVRAALVPPEVSRTVAGPTLLVLRTPDPGSGLAHYLWYYLTSARGRAEVEARLTATSLPTLSARALSEVPVALPRAHELRRLADLIEASEASYRAAVEAAEVRHELMREAIVGEIASRERREELAWR